MFFSMPEFLNMRQFLYYQILSQVYCLNLIYSFLMCWSISLKKLGVAISKIWLHFCLTVNHERYTRSYEYNLECLSSNNHDWNFFLISWANWSLEVHTYIWGVILWPPCAYLYKYVLHDFFPYFASLYMFLKTILWDNFIKITFVILITS